jgi:phosphate:Na+ symporter
VALIIGMLIGGLGLFLLAVSMITDGLKLAAGNTLKDILGRYTSTPLRGVLSGMLVTGVVQSSSAVTVATIGFVNAGLLTLPQSLGVVYGANIGTTMTGWLVAAVGLDFKIEALALPLVGIGMLGRLLKKAGRLGAVGEAVAGFGLFFFGIGVLRDAFASYAGAVDVASFAPQGGLGMLLYVMLGFLMTLFTQSSSAAIALTLTAASGGALSMNAAAALVIGANLGTTSTAAFATIGATANARRVAAAHVVFNGLTAVVALLLLPVMLWATRQATAVLGVDAPAVSLALFHTAFNVLGVALMWPLTARLAAFLARRFVTRAETLARPLHLDHTVLVTPALAMEALKQELLRAMELTRQAAATAVSVEGRTPDAAREQWHGLRGLLDAVEGFVAELEGGRMPAELAGELPLLLRISNYLEDVIILAEGLDRQRADVDAVTRPPVLDAVAGFQAEMVAQLGRCRPDAADFDRQGLDDGMAGLRHRWHELKTELLQAASRRELPLGRLNGALEGLRSGLRMTEQLTKAAVRMDTMIAAPAAEKWAEH